MKYEGSKYDKDPKGTKEGSPADRARDKVGMAKMKAAAKKKSKPKKRGKK